VAVVCLALQTADAVEGTNYRLPLGLSVVGGYVLADFISGIAHWAGDTVGDERTPIFGPHFVTPFRHHHVDPTDITQHDFVETNGNNCIVSAPVLVAVTLTMPRTAGWPLYLCVLMASGAFFVFCTNQFHKWAHAARAPRPVRWLQRNRIILSPEHHAIHHAAPHDKYYCITVGWMNPVLQWLRFFRACEAVVGWVRPSLLHLDERRRSAAD
jgi:ubiquitin-conjugating enzyme E2 variant